MSRRAPRRLRADEITLRRARPEDVPALAAMIERADLPPMFIEEFLGCFVVAERVGEIVGCGGVETYGECAVIRSVVVEPEAQGLGLGRRLAEALMEKARAAGATDLYLFTADAWAFWQRLGFVDVTFEEWREEPRECWQYVVVSQNRELEMFAGIHTMWRKAAE